MNVLEPEPKIFGIGAHKTGLTSLCEALRLLNFKISQWEHHDVITTDIRRGNFRLELLNEFDGIADFPIPSIHRELDLNYPGSKFILTVRDPDSWLRSVENHTRDRRLDYEEYLFYGVWNWDRDVFLERFKKHNEEVLRYFTHRRNDFLLMNIQGGDGWEKICTFLGLSLPPQAFPHLGKSIYR